jgi:hypothetical protein
MLGRSRPGPVLVVARIPLIRASVVTRYLIAAEPAVMRAPLAYTTFTGGKIVIATDDAGRARSVLRA